MTTVIEPRRIRALASPIRLAIVDALEAVGPVSVAELASLLGMRPDAMYYHLRILERQRLITTAGRRSTSGSVLDVAARRLAIVYEPANSGNRTAVTTLVGAMLRLAHRLFARAFRSGVRVSGKTRQLWAAQSTARLATADLRRVNELLQELLDVLAEARQRGSEGALYTVTFVVSPGREAGHA